MQAGDTIQVERKSGYSTIGVLQWMDECNVFVIGSVGDDTHREILIPWCNIEQIKGEKVDRYAGRN